MRVFVVDDSDQFRDRLIRHLSEQPAIEIIGEACDGEQALASISSLLPDVVLLDLHMPKIDGYAVLADIKRRFSAIRVIVLTNDATPMLRDVCVALGADAFIDKNDAAATVAPVLATVCGASHMEAPRE